MEHRRLDEIPIDLIDAAENPRDTHDEESLMGLANTIRERGLEQPVVVRRAGDRYDLLIGSRRLRGAKLAGHTSILALVELNNLSKSEILERQLCENLQRQDFTPREKAIAFNRLIDEKGCTAGDVAASLGIAASTVTKYLSVLKLPDDLQQRIGSRGLGLSAAYQISLAGSEEAQRRLADDLTSGVLTRDDVIAHRKQKRKSRKAERNKARTGRNQITLPLGEGRTLAVTGSVPTLDLLIACVADLLEQLKSVHAQGVELAVAVELLSKP